MTIGERIKTTRINKNLSMNQLSKLSGAPQSALSQIEAGNRQPTFDMLERIVKGLGYTLSDFFSEDDPEFTPDQRLLLESYDSLREDQKKAIRDLIEVLKKQ